MAITYIDPVQLTISSIGSWIDIDVSAHIPAGATGVILHVENVSTNSADIYDISFRKNGSTDGYSGKINFNTHEFFFVGVDANRIFEIFTVNILNVNVYLTGYFGSEVVFFDNYTAKTITTGSYQDIDISADTGTDTAIGAIFSVVNESISARQASLRKKGSTDDFKRYLNQYFNACSIIGVDENEICQGYIGDTSVKLRLIGYIKSGAVFNTNATNITPSTAASWVDLTALPAGASGGFIQMAVSGDSKCGLRPNGSTENIVRFIRGTAWAIVKCDNDRIIEGYKENTDVSFYLTGYSIASGDATIVAPVAETTVDAPTPTVDVRYTVDAVVAESTADMSAPAIVTPDATISAVVAEMVADMPSPAIPNNVIATDVATATADISAPTIQTGCSVDVPVATTTAEMPTPFVTIIVDTTITAPVATATADMSVPVIITNVIKLEYALKVVKEVSFNLKATKEISYTLKLGGEI